jgi:hypothetical protein
LFTRCSPGDFGKPFLNELQGSRHGFPVDLRLCAEICEIVFAMVLLPFYGLCEIGSVRFLPFFVRMLSFPNDSGVPCPSVIEN